MWQTPADRSPAITRQTRSAGTGPLNGSSGSIFQPSGKIFPRADFHRVPGIDVDELLLDTRPVQSPPEGTRQPAGVVLKPAPPIRHPEDPAVRPDEYHVKSGPLQQVAQGTGRKIIEMRGPQAPPMRPHEAGRDASDVRRHYIKQASRLQHPVDLVEFGLRICQVFDHI